MDQKQVLNIEKSDAYDRLTTRKGCLARAVAAGPTFAPIAAGPHHGPADVGDRFVAKIGRFCDAAQRQVTAGITNSLGTADQKFGVKVQPAARTLEGTHLETYRRLPSFARPATKD